MVSCASPDAGDIACGSVFKPHVMVGRLMHAVTAVTHRRRLVSHKGPAIRLSAEVTGYVVVNINNTQKEAVK